MRTKAIWVMILSCVGTLAQAQNDFHYDASALEGESMPIIEVDTTLFRSSSIAGADPYTEATRYYRLPTSTRRRGLYYTTAAQLIIPEPHFISLDQPLAGSSIGVNSSQSNYRLGLRAADARRIGSAWWLSSSMWGRTGRDQFIEGVFRNTLAPSLSLSRYFGDHHFIKIDASLYYSMRGLQYGSTPEAFALVGSPYYNPSWGFYRGKVRNSRVRREFSPSTSVHYQRPIGKGSTLAIKGSLRYDREANSFLGWYNATTPMADYYRKMPSFLPAGQVQDYLTELWRTADPTYTQINWDELERINSLSAEGNAFYMLEDRTERITEGHAAAIISSHLGRSTTLRYGLESRVSSSRNFKEVRDLLSADHFVDYDIFMGDSYNKTTPLQNDLRHPNRVVREGDRFGYDYTLYNSSLRALLGAEYRGRHLDLDLEALVGQQSIYREGHFNKERFEGSASYGASKSIASTPYTLRATVGYAMGAAHYFSFKILTAQLDEQAQRTAFLNPTMASYIAPSGGSGERISSLSIAYKYNSSRLSLWGEIYALQSRSGRAIYSLYDDLSRTMCRASITQIGYSSYGLELTANLYLHHDLRLSASLSAGRYLYDRDPYIELFDDYDLTRLSAPTPSRLSGISIGNAPQMVASASASYFGLSRYNFGLSSSYGGLSYEQPSIARRSERLRSEALLNDESEAAALRQVRLGDVFDIELSVMRFFWFENSSRIMVRLSIKNLLGQNNRVSYAKESDRIMLQSIDNCFTGATMRESLYQYSQPRTISLSLSYNF